MTEGVVKVSGSALLRRYAILAYGTLGTMLDVGLMVLGSVLTGLAIAVLLAGFGIVDVVRQLSTGAMLVSAVVLGVAGLFCLGIASEGPLGRGRRLVGFRPWEIGIGRVIAVFLVGLGGLLLYDALTGLVAGLPQPLIQGVLGLRAVAVAGVTVMPLLGVPLSLMLHLSPLGARSTQYADVPLMFVVWAVSAVVSLT